MKYTRPTLEPVKTPEYERNFNGWMAKLTDHLTKPRPVAFVRKLQTVLVTITLAMVTYFLASPYLGQEKLDLKPNGPFNVGLISPETVSSPKEIVYEDEIKTNLERAKAYNSGSFVFDRDYSVLSLIHNYIDQDIEVLKSISVLGESTKNVYTLQSRNQRWKNISKDDAEIFLSQTKKDKLKAYLSQSTNLIFSTYCILKDPAPEMQSISASGGMVNNKDSKEKYSSLIGSKIFPRSNLFKNAKTQESVSKLLEDKMGKIDSKLLLAVKRRALSYIYSFPGCTFNVEESENEKKLKRDSVKPVMSKIDKGETIIRRGELITPEVRYKLEKLNQFATRANIASILSVILVQLVFVGIISVFLKKYDPKKLNDVSNNVIIFSIIWIFTWLAYLMSKFYYHPDNNFDNTYYFSIFLPIGMVCLIAGFIFDEQLAVALGFYLSFFVYLLARNNPTCFTIAFSVGVVASISGSKIRKRLDFLKAGFYIFGVELFVATSGYLMDTKQFGSGGNYAGSFLGDLYHYNYARLTIACFLNGILCVTLAQIILPVYEYIFNIPTRFKLQELADTGHPLLQALLTKAPSTYTHTFLVAAMSERAAQNLGLDWLLVRAGVYFHDIGKIPNAGFFVENQHLIPKTENIDRNNPGLAAKIVIDHVIDGIEMAKKARLPREVINFIPEHHGTSTMAFFYHKALADLSPNQRKKINRKDFMYPGPKPQRKETGIVMIADSVEAASRSLEVVTPQSLDDLIQKIINIKLAENQLDESGLTLGDLNIVKFSFKEILLSSLHSRPKYPNTEDTKKLENEKAVARKKSKK